MRLIKPKVELIKQEPGVEGLFKHMELCARTCYKSEDKITEDSAKKFINNVIVARGHTAMLEHGTVYLRIPDVSSDGQWIYPAEGKYLGNKYSIAIPKLEGIAQNPYSVLYVTTNYRVILQNGWIDDLRYLCEPTEYHDKRITVRFTCDMGVAREFCRHRVFSFAQESTRYCNYSKDKFGNELTFIQPCWGMSHTGNYHGVDNFDGDYYEHSLRDAERHYFKLLELGWKPQQARNVLPLALKTELIMTGTAMQWIEFLKLRCATDAHPQARELAIQLRDRLLLENYIDIDEEGNLQVPKRHQKTEARSS